MEFIFILFVLLLIISLLFYWYSFPFKDDDESEEFVIIDIVQNLKRLCPLTAGNNWKLLPLTFGLSRCWWNKLPDLRTNINLYGAATAVTCSSVYAFSLLTDVTKLQEWEPKSDAEFVHVKPTLDREVNKDDFMQADPVTNSRCTHDVADNTSMYRFISLEEKSVKWLLLWDAGKVEFMFFLIQPVINKSVDNQCLITHIYATTRQLSSNGAASVSQRVKNIEEFLVMSQLHVVSSKSTSPRPEASCSKCSSALSSQVKKGNEQKSLPQVGSGDREKLFFVLVPISKYVFGRFLRKKGYQLRLSKKDGGKVKVKKQGSTSALKKLTKLPLRRANSDFTLHPTTQRKFASNIDLSHNSPDQGPEPTAHGSNPLKSPEKTPHENFRRFSEPEKKASSSDVVTDDDYVNLQVIAEEVADKRVVVTEQCYKNELFGSSSDFELLDSGQQFLKCKIADFLTQGNYGASELQAETMITSEFDENTNCGDEVYGGWMYHSHYKGIAVLSKITAGQFMKIISYLCQAEICAPPLDVWKCVKNPRFRFFSDETVKTVKIIERISDTQRLIHVYHELSGIFRKEATDFCLLQTEREESGRFYSSFHSMEYEKCPFMTSVVRGSLRPSGWVIETLGPKRCKVTHMMQALVSSSDSLFISQLGTQVPQSVHSLRSYLASLPK